MDEHLLAAQYALTGNLMDLCKSTAWLQSSAEIEAEGQPEAGLAMKTYSCQVNALTHGEVQQLRQQMQIQSFLFTRLRQWMESWDLSTEFEVAYRDARRQIRQSLTHLTPTQRTLVQELSAEPLQPAIASTVSQEKIIELLSELLMERGNLG